MNPFDLVKNLQQLQGQMGEIQKKMQSLSVTGSSGGEMVRVVINGQLEVQDIAIAPEAVDPRDVKMLEDLILAAMNDAYSKIRLKIQEEAGGLAGMGGAGFPGFPS